MHRLNEQGMEILCRGARRVFLGPTVQQMEIVAEYVVEPVDGLLKLLFLRPFTLGFLANARLNFRPVFRSHREAHILNELSGGIIGRQAEQLRGEPDHVAFLLTAEADKVLIDFHAWSLIRMKRTAGHPGTVDFYAVMLRDFAGADLFFYLGVDPQKHHLLSRQGKKKAPVFIGKTQVKTDAHHLSLFCCFFLRA